MYIPIIYRVQKEQERKREREKEGKKCDKENCNKWIDSEGERLPRDLVTSLLVGFSIINPPIVGNTQMVTPPASGQLPLVPASDCPSEVSSGTTASGNATRNSGMIRLGS